MTVKDIVTSCQNQWKGLLEYNKKFNIVLKFSCSELITIKLDYRYFDNREYLFYLRNREVVYWTMLDLNTLEIMVLGEYRHA